MNGFPRFNVFSIFLLVLLTFVASACSVPEKAAHLSKSVASLPKELILYHAAGQIPQSVLDTYQKETGVVVTLKTYASQEEAVAVIKGGEHFDIAILENESIPGLREGNFLAAIDYQNVPNFKNISAGFMDMAFDPRNRFSVPYSWGVGGPAIRSDRIKGGFSGWNDLWQNNLPGKIILPREPHIVTGVALKSLGYSFNSENLKELDAAEKLLKTVQNRIVFYSNDAEGAALLAQGENAAAISRAGLVLQAQAKNPAVQFVIPKEGLFLWGDNLVIPASSQRKAEAEKFINFVLEPKIRAEIVNFNFYATPNEAAAQWVNPEILNNPIIYPPQKSLERSEVILPLRPEARKRYIEIFVQLETQN